MNKITERIILQDITRNEMILRGLAPDFPDDEMSEINEISIPTTCKYEIAKDLRDLLWCSMNNADSLDLDQLTFAELLEGNNMRILVVIADVDALMAAKSKIDNHTSQNTVSVSTVARIFSMLPEKLSTNLASLCRDSDR